MKYFSYVVSRDYGFAPNPFHGICTLATCKPVIRKQANIGDWIFGTGSISLKCKCKLIYAMQVTDKITYDEYWSDPYFAKKKPNMLGSLVQNYGDNIYHQNEGVWIQSNSHHSYENGVVNKYNLNRDTGSKSVLISEQFYYFGRNYIDIPNDIENEVCQKRQGFKYVNEKYAEKLLLLCTNQPQYIGNPIQFDNFTRHDGKYS